MPRPRSILIAIAGILAAIVVAALVVLPRAIDVDVYRPDLEARLSGAIGRPVTLAPLRLALGWGVGVRSGSVRIGEATPAAEGHGAMLEAHGVRVRVALLPLLQRRLVARSFHLASVSLQIGSASLVSDGRIEGRFDTNGDGTVRTTGSAVGRLAVLPRRPEASIDFAATLRESRIDLESAAVRIGPGSFSLRGEIDGARGGALSARLTIAGGIEESTCEGTLRGEVRDGGPAGGLDLTCPTLDLERILVLSRGASRVHGLALSHVSAHGELADGTLRFDDATFELFGRQHHASLSARPFEPGLPFELACRLSDLPVATIAATLSPRRTAALRGTGDLELALRGSAPGGQATRTSLSGSARLSVRDGGLATLGVLRQIGRLLQNAGGNGIGPEDTPFRAMSATFRIEGGAGRTDDLTIRSDDLDLDGHGTVVLDGALDLDVLVSFSQGASAGLVERNPRLRMRVGKDGRLTVPLRIAGSVGAPEVRLDVERVLDEGVERLLEDKGKGFWKKLLGGK